MTHRPSRSKRTKTNAKELEIPFAPPSQTIWHSAMAPAVREIGNTADNLIAFMKKMCMIAFDVKFSRITREA